MSNHSDTIDTTKLNQSRERAAEKTDRLAEFSLNIWYLIVGAIVAAPLNLLLRPISFQNGDLRYGPRIVLESAPWWMIPLISFILFLIISVLIFVIYIIWIGLIGYEETTISYHSENGEEFIDRFKQYVMTESDSLDVNFGKRTFAIKINTFIGSLGVEREFENEDVLICIDPDRKSAHNIMSVAPFQNVTGIFFKLFYPEKVAEFRIYQNKREIKLQYDPYNEKCTSLLDNITEEFSES